MNSFIFRASPTYIHDNAIKTSILAVFARNPPSFT
jgi:hypothetical protein